MGLFDFSKKKNASPRHKAEGVISELDRELKAQDEQIASIHKAEKKFENDGDIEALILFWENIWKRGGLLFNGATWTFRLPDLYIKQKRYDDALRIVRRIKNPAYQDRAKGYIDKIQKAKSKETAKRKR